MVIGQEAFAEKLQTSIIIGVESANLIIAWGQPISANCVIERV